MQAKKERHNRRLRFVIAGIPLIWQGSNCLHFLFGNYVSIDLGGGYSALPGQGEVKLSDED